MHLPPSLLHVTVPECFSPSALGAASECRLRRVVTSSSAADHEVLASGPEAAIGRLFHRIVERAGREANLDVEEAFRTEYEAAVHEIRQDPRRAQFAELSATKSASDWNRTRAWVLRRAAQNRVKIGQPERLSFGSRLSGFEVGLESRALRLRGRADRIRRIGPHSFEIRDLKTGAVLDEHGEIKSEIVLQLQAYGLMLLERQPNAEIRLVVDDGEERDVAFGVDARKAAEESFQAFAKSMPVAGIARADELANPSSSCWGCPIRHVCPAYREMSPAWWTRYPAAIERLSNDIWGTLLEVEDQDRVRVLIRDDASRRVRIDGLHARHGITQRNVGEKLWFFGLEATGATRGFDGGRFHPRLFHELSRDKLERRAWALQIFADRGMQRT